MGFNGDVEAGSYLQIALNVMMHGRDFESLWDSARELSSSDHKQTRTSQRSFEMAMSPFVCFRGLLRDSKLYRGERATSP